MTDVLQVLNWDEYRLIKAIADARGLPGAATRTGLNHSTVFRRLGQIETALGTFLFERHRTGYALTPAGEEIVALASRLDADITAVTRKLAGREVLPTGELRVTTSDTLLASLLTPLFARFRRQYPDVRLDVVLSNQSLNLSKRDADIAIRATDTPPENLVGRRVAGIAWALYAGREDEAADSLDLPSLLAACDWVSMSEGFMALKAVRFVHEHVAPERIVYRVNTVLGLAEAIEAGIGIGYLPCFIGDARPGLVRLLLPQPEYGADLWFLTHPDLRHSARVRVLLDFMASDIASLRPLLEGQVPQPQKSQPQNP